MKPGEYYAIGRLAQVKREVVVTEFVPIHEGEIKQVTGDNGVLFVDGTFWQGSSYETAVPKPKEEAKV